jgi:hypothetical protein
MFWRQMGGHLRRVETCSAGVTWGIGYDNTAWVYTGGWGGSFLRGEILVIIWHGAAVYVRRCCGPFFREINIAIVTRHGFILTIGFIKGL